MTESLLKKRHLVTVESKDPPYIIVWYPGSQVSCDYSHGAPAGLFVVEENEYYAMHRRLAKYKSLKVYQDHSNGGHGCIIELDLAEEIKRCVIAIIHPDRATLEWVRRIERATFWQDLMTGVDSEIGLEETDDEGDNE